MNAAACQQAAQGLGAGIGDSLRSVDCAATAMAQAAFNRLFTSDGAFGPAFTILLVLWIAFLGFSLMTGRSRIGLTSLTPRMVTLVLVITFATSWLAFQSVFWNLAVGAPDEIAGALMGTQGSATMIFADKLDVVMGALMDVSGGQETPDSISLFSPPGLLWAGGTMLLLGTVGVLATCKIALAILMGLGPIFIVMALFDGTRGLFVGWLKGIVMLALAPLFAVLGGSLMLEIAAPVLATMLQTPGRIDVRPAMSFFMIGAVHMALMFMVLKVASTMVAGWSVFGLARNDDSDRRSGPAVPAAAPARAASVPAQASSAIPGRAAAGITTPGRDIKLPASAPVAANDTGPGSNTVTRETKIISGGSAANPGDQGPSNSNRARGIGSRFKSAPVRKSEKPQ